MSSLESPNARALSMLASTAEKATWHVQSFYLSRAVTKIISSTWVCQRHISHDKSFQAFLLLFILQATKAARGGLGMRLWLTLSVEQCILHVMYNVA